MSTSVAANQEAVSRLTGAKLRWTGVRPAQDVVPELDRGLLLHGGPPLRRAPRSVIRNALAGALLLEDRVASLEEGRAVVDSGGLRLEAAGDHGICAPLSGVVSASMPLVVVEDLETGVEAYSPMSEGGGCVLRFGCIGEGTIARLRRLSSVLGPRCDELLRQVGGIELGTRIASAVHMGDDCHHRFRALQMDLALVLNEVADQADWSARDRRLIAGAVSGNPFFPLNIVAAAAKAACRAAEGLEGSTLVTCIGRNGIDVGIQISAFPRRWFTAPVASVTAVETEPGASTEADPDTGDSCIIEAYGLGLCALPAAPTLARWFGGTVEAMTALSGEAYQITLAEHPLYTLPSLNFRGTPTGFDARLVVETKAVPITETILVAPERDPIVAGVGYSRVPLTVFEQACEALTL